MKKKYLIAEGWNHIFGGSEVSYTRWAADTVARKLVAGFIRNRGWWEPLGGYMLLDLQEDVEDNVFYYMTKEDRWMMEDYDLIKSNALPDWAMSPNDAHPA
ncbi:hypothetical protein [Rhizobium skierniewicense]|uniref:hypothetical protein n=1 Tax=Rhizobium skierniewicense TaxID=984260 RepID=UPI001574C7F4|nr:hypothetical protein [Rhizobium skierniewicense]NTF31787.1 hypothetical protein [Rhizobium skierniewicense]